MSSAAPRCGEHLQIHGLFFGKMRYCRGQFSHVAANAGVVEQCGANVEANVKHA